VAGRDTEVIADLYLVKPGGLWNFAVATYLTSELDLGYNAYFLDL